MSNDKAIITKQITNLFGMDRNNPEFIAGTEITDFKIFGEVTKSNWAHKLFIPKRPAVPFNLVDVEYYKFESEMFGFLYNFLMTPNGSFAWLFGPSGTGKSSAPSQLCARLNWPFFEFNASKRTERIDLEGSYIPTEGGMEFFEGPLTKAATIGGVLLINEPSLMEASELAGLNDIKPGKPFFLASKNCEIIVHKNFRLILADNTNGSGQGTMFGYVGTNKMNSAFLDRCRGFGARYMETSDEVDMVLNKIKMAFTNGDFLISEKAFNDFISELEQVIDTLVDFANALRTEAEAQQLSFPMTPRTVLDIVACMLQYRMCDNKLVKAIQQCYLWQFNDAERVKVDQLFKSKFNISIIEKSRRAA
ncbi:AAA family ATPase [Photobacterium kishitanii]|uniref:AAA family ATPase n=1 Tax=Photobacterium kishitanii TaxID=318456 RepID=UPI0007F8ABAF|nr:AAA family ATPase [Photobacterium kishitanii]OBU31426.1 hypothetical protein AYY23_19380 [Photobacterium kishitanii]PSW46840.1 hypothetical protein C0W66_21280 [Photobacterium kishitanii]